MVRNYKRKTNRGSTYTPETLEMALDEISRGITTQYAAHKKYNIPQMTLSYHRRGQWGKKSTTQGEALQFPSKKKESLPKVW